MDNAVLYATLRSQADAWASIYAREDEPAYLLSSFLLGLRTGIERRAGLLKPEARGGYGCPAGYDWKAYGNGSGVANELDEELIRLYADKCSEAAASSKDQFQEDSPSLSSTPLERP